MKTWGCPVQFKDIGLARNKTTLDRPLNAKRDEVTINGYFVGHEGMAIRIYQRNLHRIIKKAVQHIEFHEGAYTHPVAVFPAKQSA